MSGDTVTIRSAGGVVLRGSPRDPEVLLIATHGGRRWALPKGRIELDEQPRDAALREVAEETGIQAEVVAPLDTIEYWFYARSNVRHHKFVDYFLMRYRAGDLVPQIQEVDDARWLPLSEALNCVSYANDRRILKAAASLWQRTLRTPH